MSAEQQEPKMSAGKALLRGKSMQGKLALINIEKAESAVSSEQLTQSHSESALSSGRADVGGAAATGGPVVHHQKHHHHKVLKSFDHRNTEGESESGSDDDAAYDRSFHEALRQANAALGNEGAADPGSPESPPESPKAGGPAAQDFHGGARGIQRVDSLEDDSPFSLNRTDNREPQGALDREYEATVVARIRMLKEMNSPEIANILQTTQAMQPLSRLEARQISSKLKRDLVALLEEEMETAESMTLQEKMAMTKKIWRLRNEYDESKKD